MENPRLIASGLRFPEGPLVMADGSLIFCEMLAGRLSQVRPPSTDVAVVAELGGGANGAALGPDGAIYVCNNGGYAFTDLGVMLLPTAEPYGRDQADDYSGGRIERVDPETGEVTVLYTECDGNPLKSPNDIVFDSAGHFWFTDHGHARPREEDRGGLYYAAADGSSIVEAVFPLNRPNGVGLSPAGDRVYVAETMTGRLWAWGLDGPGNLVKAVPYGTGGTLVTGLPGLQYFDSLGVEADGNVCVATLLNGGITVCSPDGSRVEHVPSGGEFSDVLTTNICWGGDDMQTAYITLSSSGRIIAVDWPRPGLRLAYP
jgi:gluconolactonase